MDRGRLHLLPGRRLHSHVAGQPENTQLLLLLSEQRQAVMVVYGVQRARSKLPCYHVGRRDIVDACCVRMTVPSSAGSALIGRC